MASGLRLGGLSSGPRHRHHRQPAHDDRAPAARVGSSASRRRSRRARTRCATSRRSSSRSRARRRTSPRPARGRRRRRSPRRDSARVGARVVGQRPAGHLQRRGLAARDERRRARSTRRRARTRRRSPSRCRPRRRTYNVDIAANSTVDQIVAQDQRRLGAAGHRAQLQRPARSSSAQGDRRGRQSFTATGQRAHRRDRRGRPAPTRSSRSTASPTRARRTRSPTSSPAPSSRSTA